MLRRSLDRIGSFAESFRHRTTSLRRKFRNAHGVSFVVERAPALRRDRASR
jgi:hypothetical protein